MIIRKKLGKVLKLYINKIARVKDPKEPQITCLTLLIEHHLLVCYINVCKTLVKGLILGIWSQKYLYIPCLPSLLSLSNMSIGPVQIFSKGREREQR